jgi:hypothetical protein
MDNFPRQQLVTIIAKHGHTLCQDPARCEALLRESCDESFPEVSLLMNALKEQVPLELLSSPSNVPRRLLQARLVRRLEENFCLKKDAAQWAVDSWALALGLLETPTILQFGEIQERKVNSNISKPSAPSHTEIKHRLENIFQLETPSNASSPSKGPGTRQSTSIESSLLSAQDFRPTLSTIKANRKIRTACIGGFIYGLMMISHLFLHQYSNIPPDSSSYNAWYILTFHDIHLNLFTYLGTFVSFFIPLIGWTAGMISKSFYYLSVLDIGLTLFFGFMVFSKKSNRFSIAFFVYFCVSQIMNPMLTSTNFNDRIGWLILFIGFGYIFIQGIQGTLIYQRAVESQK